MSHPDELGAHQEGSPERIVGVRVPFAEAPAGVRAWAEEALGAPLVGVLARTGGMSPAVAASLRGANGRRLFVKAVGATVNPDTPSHFRHEIEVLRALPPAQYRVGLVSTYDDGDWVGLALSDIEGHHPDWSLEADRAAVFEAVQQQTAELTPPLPGLPMASVRVAIAKHAQTMAEVSDSEIAGLPEWAAKGLPRLTDLCRGCLEAVSDETFCHFDVRHDNILIRDGDRQPLLLDWGVSRRGPRWLDTMIYALEWVASAEFDEIVGSIGLGRAGEEAVTGFLAGTACYLLIQATHPAPPGLPNMPAFRRRVGLACLDGVRRRLAR